MKIDNINNFANLLKTSSLKNTIKPGDTVYGRIVGFSSGKALGIFNGIPLFAESKVPLTSGQKIFAKVIEVKNGKLHIKLLNKVEIEDTNCENVKKLLNSLGQVKNPINTKILQKIVSYKLPILFQTFKDIQNIYKMTEFTDMKVNLYLRLLSKFNGNLPIEIVHFINNFDMEKFRRKFSESKKFNKISLSELLDIFSDKKKFTEKVFSKTSISDTSISDTSISDTSISDTSISDTSISDTNNSKSNYIKKIKSVFDFSYNMNSAFFNIDDNNVSGNLWLKKYNLSNKNSKLKTYNIGLELSLQDFGYFDILLNHIQTNKEKNLNISFFDLDENIKKYISESYGEYLFPKIQSYDNVFINFEQNSSFEQFEPKNFDLNNVFPVGRFNVKA